MVTLRASNAIKVSVSLFILISIKLFSYSVVKLKQVAEPVEAPSF